LQAILWVPAAHAEDAPEGVLAGAGLTPVEQAVSQFAAFDPGVRGLALVDLSLGSYNAISSRIARFGCPHEKPSDAPLSIAKFSETYHASKKMGKATAILPFAD
jgi:predicted N-formylglutamate amidohydrolase